MSEVESSVREFIAKNFLTAKARGALGGDEPLMASGVLDSTGVLELTAFLESQFKINVADDELTPENLDSISNIVGYVTRKTGGS